jgi:hypothetical protein
MYYIIFDVPKTHGLAVKKRKKKKKNGKISETDGLKVVRRRRRV